MKELNLHKSKMSKAQNDIDDMNARGISAQQYLLSKGINIDISNERKRKNLKKMTMREITHQGVGLTDEEIEFEREKAFWKGKDSPFNTLEDLVKFAKENPGKLKASTNGTRASNHIGSELLAKSAGFEYMAIPYGGTADQLLALRQGEVDFSVAKEADIAAITSELKILAVFSEKRMESLPDVPTLGELGYYNKWYGSARAIVAPKGTPKEAIEFYEAAFKAAMEDPEYIASAEKAGITTLYMNAEDTAKLIQDQYKFCTDEVAKLWE